MSPAASLEHPDRFYIGGEWVAPSSSAQIDVIDSATEENFYSVPEGQASDMDRAITAARDAFDNGPWRKLSPQERAQYIRKFATELRNRGETVAEFFTRESGVLHNFTSSEADRTASLFDWYADLADRFEFEVQHPPEDMPFGALVREPIGVVGAIIPWNAPCGIAGFKVAPALLAGCTIVLKTPPDAPSTGYIYAEAAEAAGLPAGVLNTISADREVSELLVRDPRVNKISFTGSTVAGRKIAAICGERLGRYTLELGGKSAAVILDDYDIQAAADFLSAAECHQSGQVCASLTRVIVPGGRHDEMVEALANVFGSVKVGDPFDPEIQMGPLVSERQRDRVLGYIDAGVADGATLATGGGRPKDLERGWYVEPTVFGNVDNSSKIAQEEIFGPVLSVIPAKDEADAIRIANDSIYGLDGAVFTNDVERAYEVARQIDTGTMCQNVVAADFTIAFGGFKQSGVGREGGVEGLLPYLETKTVLLQDTPARFRR